MKLAVTLLFATVALGAARAPELIPNKWIVVLKDGVSDTAGVLADYSLQAERTYQHVFHGFSTTITDDAVLARLRVDSRIGILEQDQVLRLAEPTHMGPVEHGAHARPATNITTKACNTQRTSVDWGLARTCYPGALRSGVPNIYSYESRGGAGVDAYIIDTGIYSTHSDFGGRASQIWKAETSWSNTDGNGHGTHVASTTGGATWGTAKSVDNLYGIKVLSDSGSGTTAGVVNGVDFVRGRITAAKKSVANLSLGGGASTALDTAVNNLSNAGCFVAVAAGNDNADACNGSPARAAQVFSVGATTVSGNNDLRSTFSSYGTCVNIWAPGTNIQAAWIGSTTATRTISGTSMASPHVAGVGALFWAEGATTVAQVKSLITTRATSGVIDLGCSNAACRASPNVLLYGGCDCS